ncbi:uncharacterized protein LOC134831398 [Culicoides brevitarsis]|uniref:uncharacterized protein LOC134831398 n=1 Tax=Culicoides brevitarsis TaxID=469753 RepID=UPI00307C1861
MDTFNTNPFISNDDFDVDDLSDFERIRNKINRRKGFKPLLSFPSPASSISSSLPLSDDELFMQNMKWLRMCEQKVLRGEMPLTKKLREELHSACIYIYSESSGFVSEHGMSEECLSRLSSIPEPIQKPEEGPDYNFKLWVEKMIRFKVCEEKILKGEMRLTERLKNELAAASIYIRKNSFGEYESDYGSQMSKETMAYIDSQWMSDCNEDSFAP